MSIRRSPATIGQYDMHMTLPKDIPTLEACATKNFTRVDNVFCSADLVDTFISCDTYPQWRPQKTDHMLCETRGGVKSNGNFVTK